MIVDDDAGFVQMMARFLQTAGKALEVRWAYDGERALALLREAPADLLFVDLVMPGMDGLALLRTMRGEAELANIPVVIVTATDYAHGSLDDWPRSVQLYRSTGLGVLETMGCLDAILGASQLEMAGGSATAP